MNNVHLDKKSEKPPKEAQAIVPRKRAPSLNGSDARVSAPALRSFSWSSLC